MAVCKIPLTRGLFALVDNKDVELLSQHRWSIVTGGSGKYYARAVIDGKHVKMHRFLLNAQPGDVCDHRDGDGLNNTRANLRLCTTQQNCRNRGHGNQFKGVYRQGDSWVARIRDGHKKLFLGRFDTKQEAASAYRSAELRIFGEFARHESEPLVAVDVASKPPVRKYSPPTRAEKRSAIMLRLPKAVHLELLGEASARGISLNQLCLDKILGKSSQLLPEV